MFACSLWFSLLFGLLVCLGLWLLDYLDLIWWLDWCCAFICNRLTWVLLFMNVLPWKFAILLVCFYVLICDWMLINDLVIEVLYLSLGFWLTFGFVCFCFWLDIACLALCCCVDCVLVMWASFLVDCVCGLRLMVCCLIWFAFDVGYY